MAHELVLPIQIITAADVARLSRELESLESFFTEAGIRGGANTKTVPQTSQLLTALINENQLNLLHQEDREGLGAFLNQVRQRAPVVHLSFATDPRPDFLMKLLTWFRREAHPLVLFKIGLQPTIAAGCVLRTTNKYFDFSFKRHFAESKAKLGTALRTVE